MIETPEVTPTDAERTGVIRFRIPKEKMQEIFGPAIRELMEVAGTQGVDVVGPVFAHHFAMEPEVFDFELGVPVAEPLEPSGRVEPGELSAMKVARTTYHGPYEGLPDAWGEFHQWIEGEDLPWRPDIVERYIVTPDGEPDPTKWRTELVRPLVD